MPRPSQHCVLGRLISVAAVIAGLALLAGPLASAGAKVADAPKPKAIATLKVRQATVEVQKKGGDFKPATDGQKLHEGDTIRTDGTGQAEIQYSDDSYTRLDVNTTFTIKKLSDNQGNRHVDGSLDTGRAWNRTAALTESQSFEQSGAGATAAVVGTAFDVECDTPTHCIYVAVVDSVKQTGETNVAHQLNPLDECDATNGALCDDPRHLTIDEIAANNWIQYNLLLDLLERGLGPGPFQPIHGTLVVQNGQVVSFTQTTPPGGGGAPGPGPAAPNVLDPNNPIACQNSCDEPSTLSVAVPVGYAAGNSITVFGGDNVRFVANLVVSTAGLFVVFENPLPSNGDLFVLCGVECLNSVQAGVPYTADTVFEYDAHVVTSNQSDSFSFHIEDATGAHLSPSTPIPVTVECDGACSLSTSNAAATGLPTTDSPPSGQDQTAPPNDTPTTDPPTTDPPTTDPPTTAPPANDSTTTTAPAGG